MSRYRQTFNNMEDIMERWTISCRRLEYATLHKLEHRAGFGTIMG